MTFDLARGSDYSVWVEAVKFEKSRSVVNLRVKGPKADPHSVVKLELFEFKGAKRARWGKVFVHAPGARGFQGGSGDVGRQRGGDEDRRWRDLPG